MKIKTRIVIAVGHGGAGIIMHVEDTEQVWPAVSQPNQYSLADVILDNSVHIDDVFWEEHWEDVVPHKPGVYIFKGCVCFDSEGDWGLSGTFSVRQGDLKRVLYDRLDQPVSVQ